jgi:hypothetical protein
VFSSDISDIWTLRNSQIQEQVAAEAGFSKLFLQNSHVSDLTRQGLIEKGMPNCYSRIIFLKFKDMFSSQLKNQSVDTHWAARKLMSVRRIHPEKI